MLGTARLSRECFEHGTPEDAALLCRALAYLLAGTVAEHDDFHGSVYSAVERLRQSGHDLWSFDQNDDFEIWCADWGAKRATERPSLSLEVHGDPPRAAVTWGTPSSHVTLEASLPRSHLLPGFERVWTMTDFYDRPRRGIANMNGNPHIYESEWNEDHADVYLLSSVDPGLFSLALEDWEIWLRWAHAFDAGETTCDTHPAIPPDQVRHRELSRLLEGRLEADRGSAARARGVFRRVEVNATAPIGTSPLQVRWSSVDDARDAG